MVHLTGSATSHTSVSTSPSDLSGSRSRTTGSCRPFNCNVAGICTVNPEQMRWWSRHR